MNGILVVDKPSGWTSFDVIAKLRGALHTRKIGHSGTLDPLATGVLPLFAGPARKAVDLPQRQDKTYIANIKFGIRTPTADLESEVCERRPCQITQTEFIRCLADFPRAYDQLVPMYSAVKVNGQPLYKAARKGKQLEERPARPVQLQELSFLQQLDECEFSFRVHCNKGTYIRMLVEDLAKSMGQIAVMTGLRRIQSGPFSIEQAHTMDEILSCAAAGGQSEAVNRLLLPADSVFEECPSLNASEELARRLLNGAPTHISKPNGTYRVYYQGEFMGLAQLEDRVLRVKKLFCDRD